MLTDAVSKLDGFADVESLIRSKFESEAPLLTEIPEYLFKLGGKRIRPALALMVGKLLGLDTPPQALIEVAAGIELIHMATLLHDDIIDKSPLRRHSKSPFAKFGTDSTLLSGDFLLVRAFSLCAHLDQTIIDATENACIALTEGEILEIPLHIQRASIEQSLTISRKKTAALFWLAGLSGAHLAGADQTVTNLMASFGESLGISFQILDDILDVTSDQDLLGKQSGLDLIERKPSVVNVLWLDSGSNLAQTLSTAPESDQSAFAKIAITELRNGPVIRQARELATRYAEQARTCLNSAIANAKTYNRSVQRQLEGLIDYTLSRVK